MFLPVLNKVLTRPMVATDHFRELTVKRMLERHPDRWEVLMSCARAYVSINGNKIQRPKKVVSRPKQRRQIADSISPARPEFD